MTMEASVWDRVVGARGKEREAEEDAPKCKGSDAPKCKGKDAPKCTQLNSTQLNSTQFNFNSISETGGIAPKSLQGRGQRRGVAGGLGSLQTLCVVRRDERAGVYTTCRKRE